MCEGGLPDREGRDVMMRLSVPDGSAFGDMNGPLTYWGPSDVSRGQSPLTRSEDVALRKLRLHLQGMLPGNARLLEALDQLLLRPTLSV